MKNYFSSSGLRHHTKFLLTVILLISALVPAFAQKHPTYVPLRGEAADRLAIKDLIDAYGHDADRREAEKQASLFTPYSRH
jgi:hypothetical protein